MLAFALAAAGLVATALFASAAIRLRSPVSFLLGAYVLAGAEVVGLTELLSLIHRVGVRGYAVGEAILLCAALAAWLARGRPLPRFRLSDAEMLRREPLVLALAALVVASVAFQAFLVLATPPNNPDSMTYHLVRSAQSYHLHAVERFPIYDERVNALPPNGEIESLYTMVFLGNDTAAAAPQLLARLALLLAVFGLARRAAFGRPAALFAALVFSCLTLVMTQAVTTQNDLLLAAYVAAAAFLAVEALQRDPRAAPLAGLSFGLAVGTKWTALSALPALVLLVLVAAHRWKRVAVLAAWAVIGVVAFGAYAYARNLEATHSLFGRSSELQGVSIAGSPVQWARDVRRLVLDFGDNSAYFENASEDTSYFGTVGWLVILPLSAGFGIAWLFRRTTAIRGALAWALPITIAVLSLTHGYDRFSGRLLIAPVALTAPLVAWLYPRAAPAVAVAGLAAATLVLSIVFNETKPVGVLSTPAWELSRIDAQVLKDPSYNAVFYPFERRVPQEADVGMVVDDGVWLYPFYGRRLERHLTYLSPEDPFAEARRRRLEWIVFSRPGLVVGNHDGWTLTPLGDTGWRLARSSTSRP
jgi:hypothetical protein